MVICRKWCSNAWIQDFSIFLMKRKNSFTIAKHDWKCKKTKNMKILKKELQEVGVTVPLYRLHVACGPPGTCLTAQTGNKCQKQKQKGSSKYCGTAGWWLRWATKIWHLDSKKHKQVILTVSPHLDTFLDSAQILKMSWVHSKLMERSLTWWSMQHPSSMMNLLAKALSTAGGMQRACIVGQPSWINRAETILFDLLKNVWTLLKSPI